MGSLKEELDKIKDRLPKLPMGMSKKKESQDSKEAKNSG